MAIPKKSSPAEVANRTPNMRLERKLGKVCQNFVRQFVLLANTGVSPLSALLYALGSSTLWKRARSRDPEIFRKELNDATASPAFLSRTFQWDAGSLWKDGQVPDEQKAPNSALRRSIDVAFAPEPATQLEISLSSD